MCLRKKRTNFETVQLDFDDIWQKYSTYSRIESVRFGQQRAAMRCDKKVYYEVKLF